MKAEQFNMIIYLTIVAVILLILAVWAGKYFKPALSSASYRQECELSVLQNANQGWMPYFFKSKVNCKTQDITLSGNDNDEKLALAKDMKSCWDAFGRGKLNLFSNDGVYCNVCSTIGFSDTGTLTGFKDYLSTQMATPTLSYMQYLSGYENTQSDAVKLTKGELLKNDVMDKSKKYALVFVYARGKDRIFSSFVNSIKLFSQVNVIALGTVASGGNILTATAVAGSSFVSDATTVVAYSAALATPIGPALMLYDQFFTQSEWIAFTQLSELNEQNLNAMGCEMPVNG